MWKPVKFAETFRLIKTLQEVDEDDVCKKEHYQLVQDLCSQFRQETGTIICRELLDNPPSDPNPSPRTAQYYAERPCARFVMLAARILDDYIASHPVEKQP